MQRILVVVGTRPEAVKLAPVIRELRSASWAEVRLLATAQHRKMLDQVNSFFGLVPDRDLDLMRAGQSLSELSARAMSALAPALDEERPDLVLAQGDTTTVMATALSCFYRGCAFAHVEAGLRTGDMRNPFPEEMNRVLVGQLANLHFAPTKAAAQNLLAAGVATDRVHVTGNTVIDALLWTAMRQDLPAPSIPEGKRLLLVTAHRRENFGEGIVSICDAMKLLAARDDVHILLPVHPNPNVQATIHRQLGQHASIDLVEPLDYPAMVAALRACHLVITDSGGLQEEAPTFGKPILVLRTKTERPEGIDAGCAHLVGTDSETIVREASLLLDDLDRYKQMAQVHNPYGDGQAASRIVSHCREFLKV